MVVISRVWVKGGVNTSGGACGGHDDGVSGYCFVGNGVLVCIASFLN